MSRDKGNRKTAGNIWTDYKTNAGIAEKLNITPVLDKTLNHRRNWIRHVNAVPRNKLPSVINKLCIIRQKKSG
jgi:uncharacterized protein YjcR